MRRFLKILFFIVALFTSIGAGVIFLLFCSNEHREYTYYASGKVKEEITFFSKKDKTTNQNYTILSYDEKGTIWAKTMVRYGYIDAVWLFHENGNTKHFAMYKRDTIHGIQKEYAADGKEIRESMYMNGEERYVTEIDMDKNNNTRYNYSSIFKEYLSLYGTLTYDNTNTIIDSLSFGCEIIGKDTIQENELYSLKIRSYMNGRDRQCTIWQIFGHSIFCALLFKILQRFIGARKVGCSIFFCILACGNRHEITLLSAVVYHMADITHN